MKEYMFDTVIIGSGCAGFNCADRLYSLGKTNIALVTEGINSGTSRNTGSDKQTYYKLSLAGNDGDSVGKMAMDLFRYGGVNGDTALIEAAESVRSFMRLVEIGVPFPTNEYGEYVGYKTDHDPRQRATSVGPLTSKYMTEALEKQVLQKSIPIFDCCQAVKILVKDAKICGLIGVDTKTGKWVGFHCSHIVLATGGEAGLYKNSVYPHSQSGALGLAVEAGAKCANLNQWQYGIASVKFRWNLSGSYQQALPRYIRIDRNGRRSEIFPDYYAIPEETLNRVFLKGYQWPFDIRKAGGSSAIDLIVYYETTILGNRVFLDYTTEPHGLENGFDSLGKECREYLKNCGALQYGPIRRLLAINPQAVDLYKRHGIDLETEPLEISVCAQHQNGGIEVNENWESSIPGLYAAGETAGTFGAYRPGGSALNSTQVGSLRAARHIAKQNATPALSDLSSEITPLQNLIIECLRNSGKPHMEIRNYFQQQMSRYASHLRNTMEIKRLKAELDQYLQNFGALVSLKEQKNSAALLKTRDILIAASAVLSAMEYANEHLGSTGSALCVTGEGDILQSIRHGRQADNSEASDPRILITENGKSYLQNPRPIPERDLWFESVWKKYK